MGREGRAVCCSGCLRLQGAGFGVPRPLWWQHGGGDRHLGRPSACWSDEHTLGGPVRKQAAGHRAWVWVAGHGWG